MSLPNDIARCHGCTDQGQQLELCQTCERFKARGTGGPRTPYFNGQTVVRWVPHAECQYRIEAD